MKTLIRKQKGVSLYWRMKKLEEQEYMLRLDPAPLVHLAGKKKQHKNTCVTVCMWKPVPVGTYLIQYVISDNTYKNTVIMQSRTVCA